MTGICDSLEWFATAFWLLQHILKDTRVFTTLSSNLKRGQKERNENADRKLILLTRVLVPLHNIIIQKCVKGKYIYESLKLSQIGITFLLRAVLKSWWWTSLLCSLPGKEHRSPLDFFPHCFPHFPLVVSFPQGLSLTPGCTGCSSSGRWQNWPWRGPHRHLSQQNLVLQLSGDVSSHPKAK